MTLSDLLFGLLSGDTAAATVLFWLTVPIFLVGAAIWVGIQKLRGK